MQCLHNDEKPEIIINTKKREKAFFKGTMTIFQYLQDHHAEEELSSNLSDF